jgi:Flp pilus assembly secretin CpaC
VHNEAEPLPMVERCERSRVKLSTIMVAVAALAIAPYSSGAGEITSLSVHSGHSLIVPAPGLSRVAIGDGRIAGVAAIGNSEVIVNGKSAGQTTLFLWRGPRRYSYEVTVTEQALENVAAMVRSAVPIPGVQVTSFDRSVVVKGAVSSPDDMNRLADILSRFEPDAKANKYSLVNAVMLANPLGTLPSELAATPGASDIRVDRDGKGNLIVSGHVADRIAAERMLDRVRAMGGAYLAGDGKVIDRLGVDTASQVDIKVYILEVDRTALNQLGVNLQSATPDVNHPGFYVLGDPTFPVLESATANGSGKAGSGPSFPGRALNIGAFYRTVVLAPTLNLIMQSGHARLLSSPDLVTMPGRQATFLVGGEVPIPYASGPGQLAIIYKEFGVRLDVTPTILGSGGVETRIAPEVSDLDFQDAIQTSGFLIPALKTSKLSTDVVTNSGESIVMGGLLRRQEQRNINKIPLLGDLPILGKLFRSTRYQNQETDVVFVMTPQILTR